MKQEVKTRAHEEILIKMWSSPNDLSRMIEIKPFQQNILNLL